MPGVNWDTESIPQILLCMARLEFDGIPMEVLLRDPRLLRLAATLIVKDQAFIKLRVNNTSILKVKNAKADG